MEGQGLRGCSAIDESSQSSPVVRISLVVTEQIEEQQLRGRHKARGQGGLRPERPGRCGVAQPVHVLVNVLHLGRASGVGTPYLVT